MRQGHSFASGRSGTSVSDKMRTLPAALTMLRDILTLWWRTMFGVYAGDDGGAPDHRNGQRS